MKSFFTPFLLVTILLFISPRGFAQSTSLPCPPPPGVCPGTCNFSASLTYPPTKDACGGTGYSIVSVDITDGVDAGGQSTNCNSDIDRASSSSAINFTLCDQEGNVGSSCTLSDANFPDNSSWPPYGPGSNPPAGKVALSPECFAAAMANQTTNPDGSTTNSYIFMGVSSVSVDISLAASCSCPDSDSTTTDTIRLFDFTPLGLPEPDNRAKLAPDGVHANFAGAVLPSDNAVMIGNSAMILNLKPNPFRQRISFEMLAQKQQLLDIRVFTTSGVMVYNGAKMLPAGRSSQELVLDNNLPPGAYYLQLSGSNGKAVVKLIKK